MEKLDMTRTKIHEQAMVCIYQYLFYESHSDVTSKKPIEEIIFLISDC